MLIISAETYSCLRTTPKYIYPTLAPRPKPRYPLKGPSERAATCHLVRVLSMHHQQPLTGSPEALETSPRGMPVPHIPMLADSWALGIVLVNMVTRRMLWREANPASRSFCAYTHHGQAFLHCILSARVTPAAIGWLAGMLAPSPADRWTVARSKRQLAAVAEIIRPQSPLRVDCAMKISPSSQPSPPRLQELSACTSVDHELVDPFARWLEC